MKAVILAAGASTRTMPLTETRPKPLLKVLNKPIIHHTLDQLQGIAEEAIIVVGYRAEMIKQAVGAKWGGIKVSFVEQETPDGNGHALLLCKDRLKGRFLVLNGDDLYSARDLKGLAKSAYGLLAMDVDDLRSFGEVTAQEGRVVGFLEKPKEPKSGLANTGAYAFDEKVLSFQLERSPRGEYEITDFVRMLIERGQTVDCRQVKDFWLPIAYPWSLLDASEFLLARLRPAMAAKVEPGATIKGKVSAGKGTVIRAGAYLEGPVLIGRDCSIGPNCYIRPGTVVGDSCKIGNACEVKNSILGDRTSVGHLSYIGDSVIGEGVNLGAGTITANLRHDDSNIATPVKGAMVDTGRRKLGAIIGDAVHTGIHTSIYPGRKIGTGKTTLPGEVVRKDI